MLLQKAVHDPFQRVQARGGVEVVVACFKADDGVYDTSADYKKE